MTGKLLSSSPLLAPPVLVIYWLSFVSGTLLAANMAALPHLAASFGLDDAGAAKLLSALGLGGIIALLGARLSDRLGRRHMLLKSVLCTYPLIIATIFAPSIGAFALLQVALTGLAGILHITTMVAVEEHLPLAHKARGQSWVGVMFVLGNGCGLITVAVAAYFFSVDSWRYAWAFFAIALLFHPLVARFLTETPEFVLSQSSNATPTTSWSGLFAPSHIKLTLTLFAALMCWDLAQAGVNGWLIYHPVENLGISQEWVTVILIVGGWPALFGFALGVKLRDRAGGYRWAMLLSCLISAAGNAVFYSLKPDAPLLIAWLSSAYIIGLLLGNALMVNLRLLINEYYPTQSRASMQSVAVFANAFSAVIAQLVIAQLIAPLGGIAGAVASLLILKLVAAALFVGLSKPATAPGLDPSAAPLGVKL